MHEANMENTTNIKEKLTFYVTMIVATTLCLCMLAMVGAFLLGLWAKEVDNNSIFGLSGWDYIELQMRSKRLHNDSCSVIEGFGSVCVKLSVFGDDFFEYINHYIEDDDCRFSDDLILSNYYHQEKIKLKILNL